MASFGAPLTGIEKNDLADPQKFIRFGHPPVAIDILSGIDGVDFDAAWERRIEDVIDQKSGLIASIISKTDLIASKLAAGRMRDLADIGEIREAEANLPKNGTTPS